MKAGTVMVCTPILPCSVGDVIGVVVNFDDVFNVASFVVV